MAELLTRDEARRIAANIAKLPPQAATDVEACPAAATAAPARAALPVLRHAKKTVDRILTGNGLSTALKP
jgi:hypothetical protein